MVEQHMVRVLGRSAFHDTSLEASGALSYLGGEVCCFAVALKAITFCQFSSISYL